MRLPIVAYGDPILRKKAENIQKDELDLNKLVDDMFETMYGAHGVGLAGPQVGVSKRIFVIDASPFDDDEPELANFKKAFINPQVLEETGEEWPFNEGCLSIPDVREDVYRPENVRIKYFDENWVEHEETYKGLAARVIQHEYDHIEGKLFTDKLSPLRRRLIEKRLNDISRGMVKVDYKMKFPAVKKGR